MEAIVLLSGGMDSVVALYHSLRKHRVFGAISFHYGAKHNDRELPFAAHHCDKLEIEHQVIQLGFIGKLFNSSLLKSGAAIPEGHYEDESMRSTVVPFRNGIMLSIACGYAESVKSDALVIASHAGDHAIYPDCREQFMLHMGAAMRMGTYAGIQLLRPFIEKKKCEIVLEGKGLGVDFSQTWSCYNGGRTHCGKCGTCTERKEAFQLAGFEDPTIYEC